MIADVLGRDLLMNSTEESSSRGAVLHAIESKGKIGKISANTISGRKVVKTRVDKTHIYRSAQKAHSDFYAAMVGGPEGV